jgi:carbonic anhydrase
MQKLIDGIHKFQNDVVRPEKEFFGRLAHGQTPETLFITCSDSRINPNLITQTSPGDLFIIRNAGNIVPPNGAPVGGEAATIEYAVEALKVREIIVCGHTHCGAVDGLMNPDKVESLPRVSEWLKHADATRRVMQQNYAHLTGPALLNASVQENVLIQIDNLRTHPSVAAGLSAGTLRLHAWVYKIDTGEVFAFDPAERQFLPLNKIAVAAVAADDQPKQLRAI